MDPLPNLTVPETEVEDTVRPNTETENQSPESSRSTQPAPILPSEELEHAYWAEYEEDTTIPDEDEMKEIDSGDSDYSASDRRCQPYNHS
jgi:hypothetical protein